MVGCSLIGTQRRWVWIEDFLADPRVSDPPLQEVYFALHAAGVPLRADLLGLCRRGHRNPRPLRPVAHGEADPQVPPVSSGWVRSSASREGQRRVQGIAGLNHRDTEAQSTETSQGVSAEAQRRRDAEAQSHRKEGQRQHLAGCPCSVGVPACDGGTQRGGLDWRCGFIHDEVIRPRCSRRRASLRHQPAPPSTVRGILAPHPSTAFSIRTSTGSMGSGRIVLSAVSDSGVASSTSRSAAILTAASSRTASHGSGVSIALHACQVRSYGVVRLDCVTTYLAPMRSGAGDSGTGRDAKDLASAGSRAGAG